MSPLRASVVAHLLTVAAPACVQAPTHTVPPPTASTLRTAPAPTAIVAAVASGTPIEAVPPSSSPVPTPRPGGYANVDPDDDDIVGPPDALPDCEAELARVGVKWRAAKLPVHEERRKIVCGAPQVVVYVRGPGDISYVPQPLLTCRMALALASFEKILQEEAARTLPAPVVRIEQLGTYSCREMVAYPGWVSEHSYANAIDLARFVLKSGAVIDVQRDFDRGEGAPRLAAGAFLRAISQRAFDEDVFSHVLTPFFNAAHRNHFHLDLARYRGDGSRPESSPPPGA